MPTLHKNPLIFKMLVISSAAIIAACGGGDEDDNKNASSTYISFAGNSNGESVVDANNRSVKFRTATRLMEVDGVVSDVLVDNNNNLVRTGTQNIGKVQLVGSTSGKAISGMVATDGTMLAVESKTGGGLTLGKSNVVPADPNAGTATGGTGSTGGSGSVSACGGLKYPGDTSDPQTYFFDAIAQLDQCLYRATKDNRYITDGNNQCRSLDGLLRATIGNFTPLFCNGPSLKL
ncbi:hypothetical protein [Acidovorax sp. CCYZU-2555]|uniref:hypothetical protein n=1 Tax=Acidovorax sp. CCYZU-2555 TaxID=2835042 RepID=UPI001BD0FABD|nr:hypothetical protein [Acidovorax sp. CCYZU-2555]MBS7779892.1 hypothetical protein [Acidovorax sp. CCYZU-2555]